MWIGDYLNTGDLIVVKVEKGSREESSILDVTFSKQVYKCHL
jgi:hypothetical protein